MKQPLPLSEELLESVQRSLTLERLPLLIAVDGADDSGKSSLASWLAWQLAMPAVQLDLYLIKVEPMEWLIPDLNRVLARRLDRKRPVIVDGVLVLEALEQAGRKPDFLVFVTGEGSTQIQPQIAAYRAQYRPEQIADFVIDGH
jgi:uridine kinase